jgi:hypothetical protein
MAQAWNFKVTTFPDEWKLRLLEKAGWRLAEVGSVHGHAEQVVRKSLVRGVALVDPAAPNVPPAVDFGVTIT